MKLSSAKISKSLSISLSVLTVLANSAFAIDPASESLSNVEQIVTEPSHSEEEIEMNNEILMPSGLDSKDEKSNPVSEEPTFIINKGEEVQEEPKKDDKKSGVDMKTIGIVGAATAGGLALVGIISLIAYAASNNIHRYLKNKGCIEKLLKAEKIDDIDAKTRTWFEGLVKEMNRIGSTIKAAQAKAKDGKLEEAVKESVKVFNSIKKGFTKEKVENLEKIITTFDTVFKNDDNLMSFLNIKDKDKEKLVELKENLKIFYVEFFSKIKEDLVENSPSKDEVPAT